MPAPTTRPRRAARALAAGLGALLAGGLALAAAGSAQAAPADGWARVAHLSPDTKSVDVRLTALAGGDVLYELDGVAYGQVSDYLAMPAGTYVVSMVPAGADPAGTPVVSQSVDVVAGTPITVAAYGRNADLRTTVLQDDLTPPADGEARIRVVQASTEAPSVDVATSTGVSLAQGATTGAATGYATVPAGRWDLTLGGDASGTAAVDLAGGTVSTLLVLDEASGRQTVKPVLDAAAPGTIPQQGVDTGAGWLATHDDAARPGAGVLALGGVALAAAASAAVIGLRRRATAAR
ncbi:DUF4397 domain-containing protein [Cellulomonas marina]|uniref:DUF4397 domain-containing protein n=1 Tax=Cellulomonas marina TaxID=988821 RepID=A0A1I1A297_9CELL|nr:DUF4397 domain-containing protein [Cellulomonas marina]GIG30296.1 hypothetical protein Cma02nite_28960 [Cellulomonas marina]SFB31436.1 protein of unknown function [Cellulomonas marina]